MNLRLFSLIAGGCLILLFHLSAAVYYVDINSPAPTPPYSSLATAATSIQTAVNAATNGDLVLVNNGTYNTGFQLSPVTFGVPTSTAETNRLVINLPITVQSINGPATTTINGGHICRCVYLGEGAVLSGFTVAAGSAGWTSTSLGPPITHSSNGGGIIGSIVLGGTVSNCCLINNWATEYGGGAYNVTLFNCTLMNNMATNGGGAANSILYNCVVASNSATRFTGIASLSGDYGRGGGIYNSDAYGCLIASNTASYGGGVNGASFLNNCTIIRNMATLNGGVGQSIEYGKVTGGVTNSIIYFNSASTNSDYDTNAGMQISYSCVPILPATGVGNVTNAPTFMAFIGSLFTFFSTDYRLRSDSPVINAGLNAATNVTTDLAGNPRIVGGTVDMGAYEFQTPTSVISYAWLKSYNLPTDGSADYLDADHDGMNNWQEWIAGTNPTNSTSSLAINAIQPLPYEGVMVTWQSVATRMYYIERSTNLFAVPAFTVIQSNWVGQAGTTSFEDYSAGKGGPFFYRVGVQ